MTLDSDRGNIAVQAGTITAGEDVTLRASEGMVALLGGGEESFYHREASSGSNLVWQQSQDNIVPYDNKLLPLDGVLWHGMRQ